MVRAAKNQRTRKSAQAHEWPTTGMARVAEAARFLSISKTTIYELMNNGTIKWKPVGADRRISWKWLHAYADTN